MNKDELCEVPTSEELHKFLDDAMINRPLRSDFFVGAINLTAFAESIIGWQAARSIIDAELVEYAMTLRQGIQDLEDGNYEHAPRNGKCKHDKYHWEDCENCISDHMQKLLAIPVPEALAKHKAGIKPSAETEAE